MLERSYKGAALFYDLHQFVVCIFEALTVGSNAHKAKLKIHAACRTYELESCTPVSRPTMNYSVMNLPKAQALRTPHHENCGTSQAFCTPMMNLPTVSGFEHLLRIPRTKIVGRLRLVSTPMMKIADSLRLCAPTRTKIGGGGRLRL